MKRWWRRKRNRAEDRAHWCPKDHKFVVTVDADNMSTVHTHVSPNELICALRQILEIAERVEIRNRAHR